MWCANCQADVAAEVTADTRRVRCATCGGTIDSVHGARASSRTREARELLERWSSGSLLDPVTPVASPLADNTAGDLLPTPESVAETPAENASPSPTVPPPPPFAPAPRRTFRVDRSHQLLGERRPAATLERSTGSVESTSAAMVPTPASVVSPDAAIAAKPTTVDIAADSRRRADGPHFAPAEVPAERPVRRRRIRSHSGHEAGPPTPHFDVQELAQRQPQRKPNATSMTGQMLAYSGVLGLTIGTAMVVWGYFGGPDNFAPTGWLITTAGQMLLFLGVVTLVSGGMEQTTDEVARRIDTLGEKLIRIEQSSRDHALRGPSIPAERFAPDAAPQERPTKASRTPSV